MRDVHCAHARLVWDLVYELSTWGTPETYGEASRRKRMTAPCTCTGSAVRPLPGVSGPFICT